MYKRLTDKRLTSILTSKEMGCFYEPKSKEERAELVELSEQLTYEAIYTRLAELEEKIENGTLVELPCKVGDKVYALSFYNFDDCQDKRCEHLCAEYGYGYFCGKVRSGKKAVECVNIEEYEMIDFQQILCSFDAFGKTVFLTRAEAEKKLKELKGEV